MPTFINNNIIFIYMRSRSLTGSSSAMGSAVGSFLSAMGSGAIRGVSFVGTSLTSFLSSRKRN
jgi:hypothetical protein